MVSLRCTSQRNTSRTLTTHPKTIIPVAQPGRPWFHDSKISNAHSADIQGHQRTRRCFVRISSRRESDEESLICAASALAMGVKAPREPSVPLGTDTGTGSGIAGLGACALGSAAL